MNQARGIGRGRFRVSRTQRAAPLAWLASAVSQARGYERKRRVGTRLNHSRPQDREVPSPAGRGMPDPGGSADNRSRDSVTRRAPPLHGGSGVNGQAQLAGSWTNTLYKLT